MFLHAHAQRSSGALALSIWIMKSAENFEGDTHVKSPIANTQTRYIHTQGVLVKKILIIYHSMIDLGGLDSDRAA
jgi:hypothetical protein